MSKMWLYCIQVAVSCEYVNYDSVSSSAINIGCCSWAVECTGAWWWWCRWRWWWRSEGRWCRVESCASGDGWSRWQHHSQSGQVTGYLSICCDSCCSEVSASGCMSRQVYQGDKWLQCIFESGKLCFSCQALWYTDLGVACTQCLGQLSLPPSEGWSPVWAQGIPPYPFTSLSFTLSYLLLFPFLLASSIFLLFHPFPFYQNSSTPFPGRMS